TSVAASSTTAPTTASLRAGPAGSVGVSAATIPPPLAAALPANTKGSWRRASCQTGIDVPETRTAVYVESAGPSTAAAAWPAARTRGRIPSSSHVPATPVTVPAPATTQLPTLIGDVGL